MKMGASRPTDKSPETLKASVQALMRQLGLHPDDPANKLTDEEWAAAAETFWRGEPQATDTKLSDGFDALQARLDSLRRHGHAG